MGAGRQDPGYVDLGFARVDTDRAERTGDPEVVYGEGKTPGQVVELLARLHTAHPDRAVLATRLSETAIDAVLEQLPGVAVDPVARAATVGPLPTALGTVLVV